MCFIKGLGELLKISWKWFLLPSALPHPLQALPWLIVVVLIHVLGAVLFSV